MTRHVDRWSIKWDPERDELVERITRDEDIHCSRHSDGMPMLPFCNGYVYITTRHKDGECDEHKPTYTHHEVPEGETFRLPSHDEVERYGKRT